MQARSEPITLSTRPMHLLHPAFLIALTLLIANDWLLKPIFHNAITGKLSDFAGVFAFAYFWSVAAGRRHVTIHVLVGIAFAIWKSPLSQPAIDAWNALQIMSIARVVDAGDLMALLMLPLSWRIVSMPRTATRVDAESIPARVAKVLVAGIALVAFTATSKAPRTIAIEADYLSAHTTETIKTIVARDGDDLFGYEERLTVGVTFESCNDADAELTVHDHGGKAVLRLYRFSGRCAGDDLQRDTVLAALDPVLAKAFDAQRVKAGVGAVGPAVALSTPARYCPPSADRAPKPRRDPDASESTYPPKTRRKAPEPEPNAVLTAPAASPEMPSPSAAQNSN